METQSLSLVSTTPPTKQADDADQVLLAARVFRKRLLGFEEMEDIQDTITNTFLSLIRQSKVDRVSTRDTICIFQLLSSAMGSDCSYGLAESLYLCVQMEASQQERGSTPSASSQAQPDASQPIQTPKSMMTLSGDCCHVHLRCSMRRVMMQSNVRFNEMFGSMEDLRGFIWQHKLEPVYAWSRLFEPESRAAFYSALTRVLFSNDGASESCILQGTVLCLVTLIALRREPGAEDQQWGYSFYIQPLNSAAAH